MRLRKNVAHGLFAKQKGIQTQARSDILTGIGQSFNQSMTHLELRCKFFDFWQQKPRNHVLIPSSPLVPENDPTTLFTGSGMQPLIPYLLSEPHPLGTRLVDIQKCFRGQDIDEVGDNRHDSFFEMMGNWSLGDYFKKEQLAWYFEFLTKVLGFDKDKLYVTCFEGYKKVPKDTESAEIWESLGIPRERIFYYGVEKNWWSRSGVPDAMPVGEIGGPDSEVFYEYSDVQHDRKYGEKCHPNCDCGRFIEIGNSVFIQYQKQKDGSFKELPQKNVDFGGGLERTLATLNDDPDIFKTDLYSPIIKILEEYSGKKYDDGRHGFRIIADHMKAAIFLISAGVVPSNKDRGYVLRRVIRRAIRFGRKLGIEKDLGIPVGEAVIEEVYRGVYPLANDRKLVHQVISEEEKKFRRTIDAGLREFAKISGKREISAPDAFYLYESFGFPFELTEEEANNQGVKMASRKDFDEEAKRHQEQSRTASKGMFKGGLADHSEIVTKYHTATHLLQAALRKVLGDHVHQEGSNLTAERLRFDFSHGAKLTPEEIKKVEEIVNEKIQKDLQRKVETMTYDEAIKKGALAFFKERYPEKVTVYSFGDFSREICGGPHVENTAVLGKFKIIKEEAVAGGTRRIYAVLES